MLDILFAGGQLLCIAGLIYGAFLTITFRRPEKARRRTFYDQLLKHVRRTPGRRRVHHLGHSSISPALAGS